MLSRIRENDAQEKMIEGAWIGFQLGADGEMNFGDYLRNLGLLEEKSEVIEERKVTAKEAIAKAEEILRKAREKK